MYKASHHDVVRRFIKSLAHRYAFHARAETRGHRLQPPSPARKFEIRGVNPSGVLATLLDKRLMTTAGRKEVMGRPILYKSSKEFLMRFGLSDLQELPSLKEFEALAREALGSDMGVAPTTEEAMLAEPTADTLENLVASESSSSAASSDFQSAASTSAPSNPSDAEFLREEEVTATSEGMPSGELDEEPPKAEAASSGESKRNRF
jgi:segregation and condensation protein B